MTATPPASSSSATPTPPAASQYNLRLSERRAKAVADAMVGLGVAQTVMKVDWKGKTDLAVPNPGRRQGTVEPPVHHLDQLLIREQVLRFET